MTHTWIHKDGQRKQVPQSRIQRFQDEGWTMVSNTVKKKSPSKPKASAKVTKTKPKMSISKAKAEIVQEHKDVIEFEVFEGDAMAELIDIKGSQQEE